MVSIWESPGARPRGLGLSNLHPKGVPRAAARNCRPQSRPDRGRFPRELKTERGRARPLLRLCSDPRTQAAFLARVLSEVGVPRSWPLGELSPRVLRSLYLLFSLKLFYRISHLESLQSQGSAFIYETHPNGPHFLPFPFYLTLRQPQPTLPLDGRFSHTSEPEAVLLAISPLKASSVQVPLFASPV